MPNGVLSSLVIKFFSLIIGRKIGSVGNRNYLQGQTTPNGGPIAEVAAAVAYTREVWYLQADLR